jgi:Family of unknown function (DUF5985)
MATAVYLLCALASLTCALLLLAAYRRERARLLLWSCLCFGWLAVNSVLLVIDLVVVAGTDLSIARASTALVGLITLLFGLIYDTGRGEGA